MPSPSASEVENVLRAWTNAIASHDREGILANHGEDLLMFDFVNDASPRR